MPRPKAYSLPVTAPFDQWSHLDHGGRCVCRALGSVCVNLPAAAFQEGDETLQAVLQAWPIEEPRLVDSHAPLRRLARLLMHPHSKAICSRKRSREAYVVQRDDVRRARFHRSVYNRDHDSSEVYAERCVFLLEELRCPQHPQMAVGVRVWKVFIDPLWRESRAFGLLMLDEGRRLVHLWSCCSSTAASAALTCSPYWPTQNHGSVFTLRTVTGRLRHSWMPTSSTSEAEQTPW
jgi:hypothetical protein